MTKILNRGKIISSKKIEKVNIGFKIIESLKKEVKLNTSQSKGHIDHSNYTDHSDCTP